jgi:hypothetical protein
MARKKSDPKPRPKGGAKKKSGSKPRTETPRAKAPPGKKPRAKAKRTQAYPTPRAGGRRVSVFNSGLEVWLYDEANRERIANAGSPDEGFGGMPPRFERSTEQGLVVGYSLRQDDELDIEVHVGRSFTKKELGVGHWLEPQHALLKLPSGALCIESNDASRVGPERPGEKGAIVEVPPGDYRLTLLRVDHEALDREEREWAGPQEVVLLTPGGKAADAASTLLPFEERRDTTWVGKHTTRGSKADVLVWFGDYWDTYFVNLDGEACAALGLEPGRYFRTHVPEAGLSIVSVFGNSWDEARRLPAPTNITLDEYGYAAVTTPQDWAPHEALFGRRETAKTRAEARHHNTWLAGTLEVLDPAAHPPSAPTTEVGLIDLASKQFFDDAFLPLLFSDMFPGTDDLEVLPLSEAISLVDSEAAELGLQPQGDIGWTHETPLGRQEIGARLYTGSPGTFAALIAAEGRIEFFFLSELLDGNWVVTGLADELGAQIMRIDDRGLPLPHPRIRLTNVDEPIPTMRATHARVLGKARVADAPQDLVEAAAALTRFLELATT